MCAKCFFLVYVVLSIVLSSYWVNGTDFCSSTLCGSGIRHIACGHTRRFATRCPRDATAIRLNNTLRAAIVNGHNVRRNLIAGGGNSKHSRSCRMATMQWDKELSYLAALNVRQCTMRHDKCHNTNDFKYSGQNLFWRTYRGRPNVALMFGRAMQRWFAEVTNSGMQYINSYPSNYSGPVIGHFTVMVADRNTRVGCAAAIYSGIRRKHFLIACNYASDNIFDFPIYSSCRNAAELCVTGVNPMYPNLCSTSEIYQFNLW